MVRPRSPRLPEQPAFHFVLAADHAQSPDRHPSMAVPSHWTLQDPGLNRWCNGDHFSHSVMLSTNNRQHPLSNIVGPHNVQKPVTSRRHKSGLRNGPHFPRFSNRKANPNKHSGSQQAGSPFRLQILCCCFYEHRSRLSIQHVIPEQKLSNDWIVLAMNRQPKLNRTPVSSLVSSIPSRIICCNRWTVCSSTSNAIFTSSTETIRAIPVDRAMVLGHH